MQLSTVAPQKLVYADHLLCIVLIVVIVGRYLELQINEGGGKEIRCPSSVCFMVVPNVSGIVLP